MARPALAADAVPDEETAIKIAAPALIEKLGVPGYMNAMRWRHWVAAADGKVWRARLALSPLPGMEDKVIELPCEDHPEKTCIFVQMGGPVVIVDRQSGKVLDVVRER